MHFSSARITKRIRWKRPPPSDLAPGRAGRCSRAPARARGRQCRERPLRARRHPAPHRADDRDLEAPNGAVAERLLRERNVDIGFIDRRLPGFDGREVQNWASTSDNRSMFVLVSDRLVPKWSEIATLINAYEVMLKPFNESHVENLLKVFWRLNRSADVLLVDRSRTARKIIRDMLERTRFNFRVDETDTGANALRAVKATAFDIVLVDAGVDGGMGAEAACRVARDAPGSKVVLIGGAVLESALHDVLKLWRPYRLNAQMRAAAPAAAAGASIAA